MTMKFDDLHGVAIDALGQGLSEHRVTDRPGWEYRTLSIGPSARATYAAIASHPADYLLLLLPLMASAALALLVNEAVVAGWDPYGAIELTKQIVDLALYVMFVTGTIRFSVHGRDALRNRFALGWGRPESRILLRTILMLLPCLVAFAPFQIFPFIGPFAGTIAAIYVWCRLSTYWSSGALDRPLDLLAAWETTRSNGGAIFKALLLVQLPFIIVLGVVGIADLDLLILLYFGHAAVPPFHLPWHAAVSAFELFWLLVTTVLMGLVCRTLTPPEWIAPPERPAPGPMSVQEAIAASIARSKAK